MARDDYGGGRGWDEGRAPRGGGRDRDAYRGEFGDVGYDPATERRWGAGGGFGGNVSGYGRGGSGAGEYGYAGGMSRGPNTEWGGGYAGGYGRQGGYGTRGGFAPDAWGGEIQGGSYGRGWGAPGGREVDLGPNRSADEWGRVSFAGRGPRGYRRSDVWINEEINEALTRHPDIDATDIEVRVENGEVALTGNVDDKYAKRLAEDIAEACPGVTDVRNQLRVGRGRSGDSGGPEAR
jgi:hypothetical protein